MKSTNIYTQLFVLFSIRIGWIFLFYQTSCHSPEVKKVSSKNEIKTPNSFYLSDLYNTLCKKQINYFTKGYVVERKEYLIDEQGDTMNFYTYNNLYKVRLKQKRRFSFEPPKLKSQRSRVFVLNKSFSLDSLLLTEEWANEFHIHAGGLWVSEFIFNKQKFLLITTAHAINYMGPLNYIVLLFDVSDEKNIHLLLASSQVAQGGQCFCDVNLDEKLDYINFEYDGRKSIDTVKLFSLNVQNKFDYIPDKYIVLKSDSVRAKYNIVKKEWF